MNMRMAFFTTALVSMTVFGALAHAEGSAESFIGDALRGNLAEVNLGKLAQENSDNPGVQSYGTMLRTEHSEAYRLAGQAAASLGQPVPTEPSKDQRALYDKLSKLKGVQFDRAFVEAMVTAHKNDIAMYEKEAALDDKAVSDYARNLLPTLRKHLAAAQELAK